jgi:hypothetical protein
MTTTFVSPHIPYNPLITASGVGNTAPIIYQKILEAKNALLSTTVMAVAILGNLYTPPADNPPRAISPDSQLINDEELLRVAEEAWARLDQEGVINEEEWSTRLAEEFSKYED